MNMIDNVARALRAGRGCEHEFPCGFCHWGPDELTPAWDETGCVWLARAAIEAMREPTEEMIDKGAAATWSPETDPPQIYEGDLKLAWEAMIDAALKGGRPKCAPAANAIPT